MAKLCITLILDIRHMVYPIENAVRPDTLTFYHCLWYKGNRDEHIRIDLN